MNGFGRSFFALPPVVKNLILLNVLMLLANWASKSVFSTDLTMILGLYFPKSEHFMPIQIITHMFMHGNFLHLFFNMFALFMFGGILENVWGPKRFFIYYIICGLGAALVHETVIMFQYNKVMGIISPDQLQLVLNDGASYLSQGKVFTNETMKTLQMLLNVPTVGASGAVFGVLLAFGVLFPNTQLMLLFPPIPIRAKYFVLGYGAIELYLAVTQPGSNIAHAAHLGGMLFGYFLIRYWRKTTRTLY
ncbi:MAG TPA: rhomboid family intramembrane serine protease [Bacteroidales bacterium]|jgi:membrane associated rhomboid family serine protease|nr:rhomboid family intramembrane serine protease [Bacteroidales bacterium]HNR42201.1 rhomboid family intramembrane serine protease [Bacteroidales bacterium]HPM17386.1 rhomboid family intramembrane serine protease [Bacteroidales bacterium]HQG76978.1 rhomboid family intramembrane serine protease [Bacteroidales bacterium]